MANLQIPEKPDSIIASLKVSTGKEDKKVEKNFEAELPKDLGSAVRFEAEANHCGLEEGARIVFKKYINSKVIELQGEERMRLAPEGEKKERKRAQYMEQLGL